MIYRTSKISMFNSKGDNFKEKHFQTPFARISCINLSHFSGFIGDVTTKQNELVRMCKANLISDLLKIGFAEISCQAGMLMIFFSRIL